MGTQPDRVVYAFFKHFIMFRQSAVSLTRRFSQRLATRPFHCSIPVRSGFQDREKDLEEKNIHEHDKQLINKLREQLHHAESQIHQLKPEAEAAKEPVGAPADYITLQEFMSFRKEMINKIHGLEEEVVALKF